jgi:hypothetical protein
MKTKKSFATPSNKPVDVQYRLKRAMESKVAVEMFMNAIDPAALPEGVHAAVLSAIVKLEQHLEAAVKGAPAKKARGKKAETIETEAAAAE